MLDYTHIEYIEVVCFTIRQITIAIFVLCSYAIARLSSITPANLTNLSLSKNFLYCSVILFYITKHYEILCYEVWEKYVNIHVSVYPNYRYEMLSRDRTIFHSRNLEIIVHTDNSLSLAITLRSLSSFFS